jgi:FlaA1/EpsC-like NDP-sugar epimerase
MAEAGETYVLEMGTPVRIVDIVARFAEYVGLPMPDVRFVGLRQGEKLTEDLFASDEHRELTSNPLIWRTQGAALPAGFDAFVGRLIARANDVDDDFVRAELPLVGSVAETGAPAFVAA